MLLPSKIAASGGTAVLGLSASVVEISGVITGVIVALVSAMTLWMALQANNRKARQQHEAEMKAEHEAGVQEERLRLTPQLEARTEQYKDAAKQRDISQDKYDALIQKQLDRLRGDPPRGGSKDDD